MLFDRSATNEVSVALMGCLHGHKSLVTRCVRGTRDAFMPPIKQARRAQCLIFLNDWRECCTASAKLINFLVVCHQHSTAQLVRPLFAQAFNTRTHKHTHIHTHKVWLHLCGNSAQSTHTCVLCARALPRAQHCNAKRSCLEWMMQYQACC